MFWRTSPASPESYLILIIRIRRCDRGNGFLLVATSSSPFVHQALDSRTMWWLRRKTRETPLLSPRVSTFDCGTSSSSSTMRSRAFCVSARQAPASPAPFKCAAKLIVNRLRHVGHMRHTPSVFPFSHSCATLIMDLQVRIHWLLIELGSVCQYILLKQRAEVICNRNAKKINDVSFKGQDLHYECNGHIIELTECKWALGFQWRGRSIQ